MRRLSAVLALSAIVIVGAGCAGGEVKTGGEANGRDVRIETPSGETITVEVADTESARASGLSGREDIGDGMLFCFDDTEVREFWMLGMLTELDMVWLRSGDVIDVTANVPVRDEDAIARRSSPAAVNGVLEVSAGRAEELGLEPGVDLPEVRTVCGQEV